MYRKLRGKITEVFGSQKAFAEATGMKENTLHNKITGRYDWTVKEMFKACDVLGIEYADAWEYFFY